MLYCYLTRREQETEHIKPLKPIGKLIPTKIVKPKKKLLVKNGGLAGISTPGEKLSQKPPKPPHSLDSLVSFESRTNPETSTTTPNGAQPTNSSPSPAPLLSGYSDSE